MNKQSKARLRVIAEQLTGITSVLTTLSTMTVSEQRAATRHAQAGNMSFSDHATWSAIGLDRAVTALRDWDLEKAITILNRIGISEPDDTPAWADTPAPTADRRTPCEEGSCNHPEHL